MSRSALASAGGRAMGTGGGMVGSGIAGDDAAAESEGGGVSWAFAGMAARSVSAKMVVAVQRDRFLVPVVCVFSMRCSSSTLGGGFVIQTVTEVVGCGRQKNS